MGQIAKPRRCGGTGVESRLVSGLGAGKSNDRRRKVSEFGNFRVERLSFPMLIPAKSLLGRFRFGSVHADCSHLGRAEPDPEWFFLFHFTHRDEG